MLMCFDSFGMCYLRYFTVNEAYYGLLHLSEYLKQHIEKVLESHTTYVTPKYRDPLEHKTQNYSLSPLPLKQLHSPNASSSVCTARYLGIPLSSDSLGSITESEYFDCKRFSYWPKESRSSFLGSLS